MSTFRLEGWANRFPWCRAPSPSVVEVPQAIYPGWLSGRHLLVDSRTLIQFMATVWGMAVSPTDLNLLEYHGLLLPARKAIVDDLAPAQVTEPADDGEISITTWGFWKHAHPDAGAERRARSTATKTRMVRMTDVRFDYGLPSAPGRIRVCPWHVHEQARWFTSKTTASDSKRLPSREAMRAFTPGWLRRKGRWLKPTDSAYWSHLGAHKDVHGILNRNGAGARAATCLAGLRANPTREVLSLDGRDAQFGNVLVTTFYLIGGSRFWEGRRGYGRVSTAQGQDWKLASLLFRIRFNAGTRELLDIVAAKQSMKVNRRRAHLDRLWEHADRMSGNELLQLPRIHPDFYRDALLHLCFREGRLDRRSPDDLYKSLAKASGLKDGSVRKAVSRGGRLLRVEST